MRGDGASEGGGVNGEIGSWRGADCGHRGARGSGDLSGG